MKYARNNPELEHAVLSLSEFHHKGWMVQTSTNYSVTLTREDKKKDKTEEVVVYASYLLN